jgi:hypothetical protein
VGAPSVHRQQRRRGGRRRARALEVIRGCTCSLHTAVKLIRSAVLLQVCLMSGFVSRDWRLKEVQTTRRALLAAATRRDTTATMLASPVMLARNQQRADAIDGGGAATPRWLSTLAASEWLRHSSEGYCASTEEAGRRFSAKACRTGHKGGSRLPLEVVKRGWLAAATECVSRCAGCERCRFVAAISQLVSRSSAASVRS